MTLEQIEAKLRNGEALDHFSKDEIVALCHCIRAWEMYFADLCDAGFVDGLQEEVFQQWASADRLQAARKALELEP